MTNLDIYNKVREVPNEAKKNIDGGRLKGMTDINPMWRIKTLTEQFGPVGFGWYYNILNKEIIQGANDEQVAIVDIEMFIKMDDVWSKPIAGTGGSAFVTKERNGLYTSDEAFKMALTDALSVSCKLLGVGADVYFGKDKTKYNAPKQPSQLQIALNNLYATVKVCGYSADEVTKLINEKYKKKSSKELTLQEVKNLQEFIKSDYEIAKKETQYQKSLDPKELLMQDADLT